MGKFGGTGGTIGKKLPVGNGAARELRVYPAARIYLTWGSALTQQLGSGPCSPSCTQLPGHVCSVLHSQRTHTPVRKTALYSGSHSEILT